MLLALYPLVQTHKSHFTWKTLTLYHTTWLRVRLVTLPPRGMTPTNVFRSPGQSFHLRPDRVTPAPTTTEVWFQTPAFSTVGNPYVFMEFSHIRKLYFLNKGTVEISTDGGNTFAPIDKSFYKGSSVGQGQYGGSGGQEEFNEATYFWPR